MGVARILSRMPQEVASKRSRKTPEQRRAALQAKLAQIDNVEAKRTKRRLEYHIAELGLVASASAGKPWLTQLTQAISLLTTASAQIKVVEVQ